MSFTARAEEPRRGRWRYNEETDSVEGEIPETPDAEEKPEEQIKDRRVNPGGYL